MTRRPLHVLVVDDSAVVREVMLAVLTMAGGMTVTCAADPVIARRRIAAERPDVIVLDLEMPREDGMTFLRDLMVTDPIPVVICSSHSQYGSREALEALVAGAVEVVAKPQLRVKEFVQESAVLLADAVRAAARARPRVASQAGYDTPPREPRIRPGAWTPSVHVIALAASTGGPQSLQAVLMALPADTPGIVVVQHMPAGFTTAFARHLDNVCALQVREAQDGEPIVDGRVYIAPGDHHLLVRRRQGQLVTQVTSGPLVSRHRPSADVLFESVAQIAGRSALGVLMTGMGADGARGLAALRAAGAQTAAQDETSCVVFGMPKEAITMGAAQHVLPLSGIADHIKHWTDRRRESPVRATVEEG